jgi:gamma-D-glutamyl-L-lysine dipeptidyl-peptidase
MKINKILQILASCLLLMMSTAGCKKHVTVAYVNYKDDIDSVSVTWVPDFREGVFDAALRTEGNKVILKGETDIPEAKAGLISVLKKKGLVFTDSMKVLPDTTFIKEPWGLVNVSVCNMRSGKANDAELVTQAVMGTPVKILKKTGSWYFVQTPDRYLGWVDIDAIEAMKTDEYKMWKASDRLFYTKKTGDIFADAQVKKSISDIVAGCILQVKGQREGFYAVALPDGRKGLINRNEAIPFDRLTPENYLTTANLRATAESFMGIPYLWGGTSPKGFDCSGFVKTVYYLNGIILSRDASQQFGHGIRLGRSSYPDSLRTGDLLFFGSSKFGRPRPTHVAMYIGDTEYINASGMVKISSLDSTRTNFSRSRRNSFMGVRRIIGAEYGRGIEPVAGNSWYK